MITWILRSLTGLRKHEADLGPIDDNCPCPTCSSGTSRAFLHHVATLETAGAHGEAGNIRPHDRLLILWTAITQHNLVFQARLMGQARDAIMNGSFPDYLKTFFAEYFGDKGYPEWCVNALRAVGVDLLEGKDIKVSSGDGAVWDRAE